MTLCKQLISRIFHLEALDRCVAECTTEILKLHRVELRNLFGIITVYWPFGIPAKRLNIPTNDFCRSCKNEEEQETSEHIFCHCIKFAV